MGYFRKHLNKGEVEDKQFRGIEERACRNCMGQLEKK